MSTPVGIPGQPLRWPHVRSPGRAGEKWRERVVGVAIAGGTAAVVAYAPVPRLIVIGLAALLVVGLVISASSRIDAVLLGVSIPEIQDVTGGHLGVHIAASDVVLILVGARMLVASRVQLLAVLRAVRPVAFPLVQYAWLIGALLVIHVSLGSALKSVQRLELFALPVLVGAFLALRRHYMTVLRGYVLAATALAVAWPILNTNATLAAQFQKNPVGGFIAGGILLVLGLHDLRQLRWCVPVLMVGLGLSASRGAVLGLIVGVVVIAIMRKGGSRRTIVAGMAAIAITGLAAFQFLPSSTTQRLTNLTGGGNSSSSWAIYYRDAYYHDAELVIASHPWTGVGVGNYLAGNAGVLTQTTDPHDVVLLEAAEGGYVFAASFLLLLLGTAVALWRHRRLELAAVAGGVLFATFSHGMVDVYWVRGTPILGWLLVGMVCGLAAAQREAEPSGLRV